MYTKTVTYTDYDGNERTEDFYFNLNKAELMEMNMSVAGGLERKLKRMIESQNAPEISAMFKEILLKSYGEKTLDGKRFVKVRDGHRLSDDFAETEAYSEIYSELLMNEEAATEFINGVIPRNLAQEMASRG